MEVPRHLYHTNVYFVNQPEIGHIVEVGDVEANVLMFPAGTMISDEDAKKYGVTEYLEAHPEVPKAEETAPESAEAKAVDQAQTEDKAVPSPESVTVDKPEDTEAKEPEPESGVSFPPETRRTGGGRRA